MPLEFRPLPAQQTQLTSTQPQWKFPLLLSSRSHTPIISATASTCSPLPIKPVYMQLHFTHSPLLSRWLLRTCFCISSLVSIWLAVHFVSALVRPPGFYPWLWKLPVAWLISTCSWSIHSHWNHFRQTDTICLLCACWACQIKTVEWDLFFLCRYWVLSICMTVQSTTQQIQ